MDEIKVGSYVEADAGPRLGERGTVKDIRGDVAYVQSDVSSEDVFEIKVWNLILV